MQFFGKKVLSVVLAAAVCMSSMMMTVSAAGKNESLRDSVNGTSAYMEENAMGSMDLSEEGSIDWYLQMGEKKIERKAGVTEQIGLKLVAPSDSLSVFGDFDNSPVSYSWSDGRPESTGSKVTNGTSMRYEPANESSVGVYLSDKNAGYDITIPAASFARTLTAVINTWQTRAVVSVVVDGTEEVAFQKTISDGGIGDDFQTLIVSVAAGDAITVKVRYDWKYQSWGSIGIGAITLSGERNEAWYRQELPTLIKNAAGLTDYSEDGALQNVIDEATALLQGEATLEQFVECYKALRAQYILAQIASESSGYTYETNEKLTSSFGWEGDVHAPIAYLDGGYMLRDRGFIMINFGVKSIPGKVKWYNAEGYLPCFISEYSKKDMAYKVENFADEVTVDGNRFEVAYSRMTATNHSDRERNLPNVSPELIPLNDAAKNAVTIQPGETIVREYCIGADRFGGNYQYPSNEEFAALGSWDTHYTHMKDYWNERLESLTQIKQLPDDYKDLINAYKAGYIYTMIIRDDVPKADGSLSMELHVGENGYDVVYDHDIIGMLVGLMTLGDFKYFDEYSDTILMNAQYNDARWKYSWPFAFYLMKTGDAELIRSKFDAIKENTHRIEAERTGNGGIMMDTWAIDSQGSWTIDNWAALMGLTSYKYICDQLGETEEADWAKAEYDALFEAVSTVIQNTIDSNNLNYIPISPTKPNDLTPASNPMNGNWASMFLFGRWGWDGYLFGAEQSGVMLDMIDDTYDYGFSRIAKQLGEFAYTCGGYVGISSGYNAGYSSTALRGEEFRDAGIKSYQWMIDNTMSGPFGWWESATSNTSDSQWEGTHTEAGVGSCQHMWGQSVNTKVLVDSLIAEKADGTVLIGRGIPAEWIGNDEVVEIDQYPVAGGKMGYTMNTDGTTLKIDFTGDTNRVKSIELLGLKDNIVSADGLTFDVAAGTVTVPADVTSVTVEMKNNPKDVIDWNNANDALTLALEKAATFVQNPEDYTKESYASFTAAVDAATKLSEDENRGTQDMNDAAAAVENAMLALKDINIIGEFDYGNGYYNNTYEFGKVGDQYKRYQTFIADETSKVTSVDVKVSDGGATSPMTVEVYTIADDNKSIGTLLASISVPKTQINFNEVTNIPLHFEMEEGKTYAIVLGQENESNSGAYTWNTYSDLASGTYFMKWNVDNNGNDVFVDESFLGHGWMRLHTVVYSKAALEALIEEAKALDEEEYTAETWKVLADTLTASNDILQNSNDVDKVVSAEAAMRLVIDQLHLAFPERSFLKDTIEAAKIAKENYPEHLIPVVQQLFEAALQTAEEVYAKGTNATVEEVQNADENLILTMQYLKFTADKDSLKQAIDYANGVVASGKYLNDNQMKRYQEAIAACQALYDDEWVTDTEINPALQAMLDAEKNLNEAPPVSSLDLTNLDREVRISSALNLKLYYDGAEKTAFSAALVQAEDILRKAREEDPSITQKMVDDATLTLHNARYTLRLIPNRDALKALIEQAKAFNANEYTAQSFTVLSAALQKAEAVYNNKASTQQEIDQVAEILDSAINGLVKISSGDNNNSSSEKPNNNSSSEKPDNNTPTGDAFPFVALSLLTLCCGAVWVLLRKKTTN